MYCLRLKELKRERVARGVRSHGLQISGAERESVKEKLIAGC